MARVGKASGAIGWSRLRLGWTTPSRSESTVATASSAPLAPSVWPSSDFVELTARPLPKISSSASASTGSLPGVPVPCALT